MINYYTLLKINPEASHFEIKRAYLNLKTELKNYSGGIEFSENEIAQHFPDLYLAYITLLDPQKRSEYDRSLNPYVTREKATEQEPEETTPSSFSKWLYYLGFVSLLALLLYMFSQLYSL